jgi:ribosomal protein S6
METENKKEGLKVYEIGYHIVPSIPEEKVPAEADAIKALLAKYKAELIAEEAPKLKPLAYQMVKNAGIVRGKFNDAYFGWVKFETGAEEIVKIKEAFDANDHMLRYLLITTVRENTMVGSKFVAKGEEAKDAPKEAAKDGKEAEKPEAKA